VRIYAKAVLECPAGRLIRLTFSAFLAIEIVGFIELTRFGDYRVGLVDWDVWLTRRGPILSIVPVH
jgi:hypothetical protein